MRRIIRKRRRKVKGRRRNQVTGALQLDLRDAGRPFPGMRFVKKMELELWGQKNTKSK